MKNLSSDVNSDLVAKLEITKCYGFAFTYLLIRKLNDISVAMEAVFLHTCFMPVIIQQGVQEHLSLRSRTGNVCKC